MCCRAGQFNVAHAVTAYLCKRDLNATFLAHHTTVFQPLVLATQTFVILHRTEDLGTEQAITLRLEGTIVNGLRFFDLAIRPGADHVRGRQTDAYRIEIISITLWL